MRNKFKGLSDSRKLEMLSLSIEEIYNAGYEDGEFSIFPKFVVKASSKSVQQPEPLTPNQQRAAVIKQAREFVEGQYKHHWNGIENKVIGHDGIFHLLKFVVNQEKRTVVALLTLYSSGQVRHTGKAKCQPDDVFNADIGKAIALARALKIEVPKEFTHAVQPTEVVVGMVVTGEGLPKKYTVARFCDDEISANFGGRPFRTNESGGWLGTEQVNITNDTKAIYEEQS